MDEISLLGEAHEDDNPDEMRKESDPCGCPPEYLKEWCDGEESCASLYCRRDDDE